jgi:hypothetical protein
MIDRDQLKEAQTPLKERYRDDAEAALVTLAAEGELGEGVSCSLSTGRSARRWESRSRVGPCGPRVTSTSAAPLPSIGTRPS